MGATQVQPFWQFVFSAHVQICLNMYLSFFKLFSILYLHCQTLLALLGLVHINSSIYSDKHLGICNILKSCKVVERFRLTTPTQKFSVHIALQLQIQNKQIASLYKLSNVYTFINYHWTLSNHSTQMSHLIYIFYYIFLHPLEASPSLCISPLI